MSLKRTAWLAFPVLLGLLALASRSTAEKGCRNGYQPYQVPQGAAVYSGDALKDGASSATREGELICVEASPENSERLANALTPARAYRPEAPNQTLTLRSEHLTHPVNSLANPTALAGVQDRAQQAMNELDRNGSVHRVPASARSVIGEVSDTPEVASCGTPQIPSFALRPKIPKIELPLPTPDVSPPADSIPDEVSGPPPAQPEGPVHPGLPSITVPAPLKDKLDELAENERRSEFYDSLLQAQSAIRDAAASDSATLAAPYEGIPLPELATRMQQARDHLTTLGDEISESASSLPEGEKIRFAQTYQNAAEKARLAKEYADELERRKTAALERAKLTGNNPLLEFLLKPAKDTNPLARSAELAELFGKNPSPTSHDGLTQRLILLEGLGEVERKEAQKKLKLSEPLQLSLKDGKSVKIPLLHNGYLLGGGSSGLDCSSFVSAALPTDIRKGRFTTWDFRTMWVYRRTGVPPKAPKYDTDRMGLVLSTSKAFDALDLYRGEEPGVGDLLVHRLPWEATGHVFVVREYHRDSMIASVIEASQSAGTVREREFPLSLDPTVRSPAEVHESRLVRPGLMVLRLRPTDQKVCSLRGNMSPRSPASVEITTPLPPSRQQQNPDRKPYRGGAY